MDQQPQFYSGQSPQQPTPGNFQLPQEKKPHTTLVIGLLSGLAVILLALLIWVFTLYTEQKNNVDQIAQERINAALEEQQAQLQAEFKQQTEAKVTRYQGPEVVGQPSFEYPKAWSLYVDQDPGGDALFSVAAHPEEVNTSTQQFALRFRAIDASYDAVLARYDGAISEGTVRSKPIKSNGVTGVRLTGEVYQDRNGSMVIFGVRDKTIMLWTESSDYTNVFNRAVESLTFQP